MLVMTKLGIALTLLLGAASVAKAEPLGSITAAPQLSERDGSVRAQAGMRFAVTHAPGSAGDHTVAIGKRLSTKLPQVRACYQAAISRDATVEGVLVARIQNVTRGGRKVELERNGTGDVHFARCVLRSLAHTRLRGLPIGAAAHVEVAVKAPAAAVKREMAQRSAEARSVSVRKAPDGRVQSQGRTQNGEVQFSLQSEADDREALVALHHDVTDRLAGLLDCRRRATRRGVTPRGTLVVEVQTDRSGVGRVRTLENPFRNPKASACVSEWLRRADRGGLSRGQVLLSLSYGP